jgi:TolB-like protein
VTLDAAAVTEHVNEALKSPLFAKAERQARFLRFVVEAALQSPTPNVREFDIALAVYDRRRDYDPRTDPIVRVEAARLRARLREYYEHSPPAYVRIDLPKGAYVPQFIVVRTTTATPSSISILVRPFRWLGEEASARTFCDGLADEVIHHLTRDGRVRVMLAVAAESVRPVKADYLLESSVRQSGDHIRVTLHLVALADGTAKLSNIYRATLQHVFATQERLAKQISDDLVTALTQPVA